MCIIELTVVPGARMTGCKQEHSGRIKCLVRSPADKGKANKELCDWIARQLGIPSHAVTIITGATSRHKRLRIDAPLTVEQVVKQLGIEPVKQLSLL